jgi:hypothetical protein
MARAGTNRAPRSMHGRGGADQRNMVSLGTDRLQLLRRLVLADAKLPACAAGASVALVRRLQPSDVAVAPWALGLPVLSLLALLLGGNHLHAALSEGRIGNWIGAAANACGSIIELFGLASRPNPLERR